MPLVPLTIPPGVHKNGTDLQNAGRWNDANLVRWYEGGMQPVNGWRARTTSAFTGVCRALLTWTNNAGSRQTAAGTESKLYFVSDANALSDITPANFSAGIPSATQNLGWGALTYGFDSYGIARPDSGSYTPATTWSLDSWGEYLLGCSNHDGKIYQWTLSPGTVAAVLSNAPTSNTAIYVTDERFVFALGAGGVGNKVQWSDQEDNNLWAPATTNQAGSLTLQTAGNLICAMGVRGQTLLFTDIDCHAATYQGPPFVYGIKAVGSGCGIASANAAATTDTAAFWMGKNSFFMYDGSVRSLPSDVGDYVFSDINVAQRSKVYAVKNSGHQEIWWFYPSSNSTENNRYVAYNYRENHWSIGSLARTAATDAGVFIYPNMVGTDNKIYEHEVGFDYDSATVFAESGPIEIGTGDRLMVAKSLIPDEKTQGDVIAKFKTRLYPNATESTHGPYTMANPTSVRFTGRQVEMRVEGNRGADWRVGTMRLDVAQGSRR
tara:strand:- start:13524 stop:14999 length:1476 start_codon:yes stop_codon:yes gene_type:complete